MCLTVTAFAAAGLLRGHCAGAQEPDRMEALLRDDVRVYTERALKDRMISREKADSIMNFMRDSLPQVQEIRLSVLRNMRDEIDELYEGFMAGMEESYNEFMIDMDDISSYDHEYMASSMQPKILDIPGDAPDPFRERHDAEIAAKIRTEELAAMHLEQSRSKIPAWAVGPLRFLFNAGMDTSGKSISVHRGLYYIPIPPGQPKSPSWAETVPKANE